MEDNIQQKINGVLSNPELMQQIMTMAQSLSGDGDDSRDEQPSIPVFNMDPEMLQKLSNIAMQSNIDSQQLALLNALNPYLSKKRILKLESAMRAAKITKLASSFLSNGLPSPLGR